MFLNSHRKNEYEPIIIGADKNCSKKSSKIRQNVMDKFTEKFQLSVILSPAFFGFWAQIEYIKT